ncbi:hypothetical protein [Streptomyces sp. XY431]|uniref:hypothetical protein n=1 Tax=Streptomyces sp. XY431 TaxID=1415562 RepID=UPI000A47F186|nr:hypothetical protein [Streptomyces sp. XY431]
MREFRTPAPPSGTVVGAFDRPITDCTAGLRAFTRTGAADCTAGEPIRTSTAPGPREYDTPGTGYIGDQLYCAAERSPDCPGKRHRDTALDDRSYSARRRHHLLQRP